MAEERRSTDSEIIKIKTQVEHLGASYDHLNSKLDAFQSRYESGFNEIRTLIIGKQTPQWGIVFSGIALITVLLGGWMTMVVSPTQKLVERNVARLDEHTEGGHPDTVVAQVEALGKSVDHQFEAVNDKILSLKESVEIRYRVQNDNMRRIDETGTKRVIEAFNKHNRSE